MQSPQAKIKEITRLLSAFPAAKTEDPEANFRNYVEAVEDYTADDVEAAVTVFLKGVAPGVNPNFVPSCAALGGECRRQMNLRLDHARLVAPPPLALPEPTITPEERERGKARFAEILGHLPAAEQERLEAEARTKERLRKSNERFMPDMSEEAISRRLGFTVGDCDGDREVA